MLVLLLEQVRSVALLVEHREQNLLVIVVRTLALRIARYFLLGESQILQLLLNILLFLQLGLLLHLFHLLLVLGLLHHHLLL